MEEIFDRRLITHIDSFLMLGGILLAAGLPGALLGVAISSYLKRGVALREKLLTVFLAGMPISVVSYVIGSVMLDNAGSQAALANMGILMMTTIACFPITLVLSMLISLCWPRAVKSPQPSAIAEESAHPG